MGSIRRKELERLVCEGCSAEFSAVLPFARFCSKQCYGRARYQKRSLPHKCVECGSDFTSKQHKASVCGPVCGMALYVRSGKKGAGISSPPRIHASRADAYRIYDLKRRGTVADFKCAEIFPAEEIFVRDRWVCKICNERVSRLVKFPHPRSVSLDHIVPLSKGGKHVRTNVQTAHFGCNSRKGAKLPMAVAG